MRRLLLTCVLAATTAFAEIPKDWTTPVDPFRIAGNLYYVGSRDLAVYLLHTPQGNILINANLQNSPPQIRASIEKLGFRYADTKILLTSQAHYDHIAGAAQVVRETGAKFQVMAGDVNVAETGGKASFDIPEDTYPAVHVDKTLHDGDTITLGGTTLTALKTAGHTQGCTTFTLHEMEKGKDLFIVIIGGMSSNPGVTYVSLHGKPVSYPGIQQDFEHTFATLHNQHPDIFLGAHGVYFNMLQKLDAGAAKNPTLWLNGADYQATITKAEKTFQQKLAKEKAEAAK